MVGANPACRWKHDLYASAGTLRRKVRRGASWQPAHVWDPPQGLSRPCAFGQQAKVGLPLALRGLAGPVPEQSAYAVQSSPAASPEQEDKLCPSPVGPLQWEDTVPDSVFSVLPGIGLAHTLTMTPVDETRLRPASPAPSDTQGHEEQSGADASVLAEPDAESPQPLDERQEVVKQQAANLRNTFLQRRRLPCPLPERAKCSSEFPFDRNDATGGNGSWRRRRAEVELSRRKKEEEERRRLERERSEERKRRRAEHEARRHKAEHEAQMRWVEKRERGNLAEADSESRCAEEADRERLRLKEEERKRLARLPKPCTMCNGTRVCNRCKGHGTIFGFFLSPKVHEAPIFKKPFGKLLQGCEACDALGRDVAGDLRTGTGLCRHCAGRGLIEPPPCVLEAQGAQREPQRE